MPRAARPAAARSKENRLLVLGSRGAEPFAAIAVCMISSSRGYMGFRVAREVHPHGAAGYSDRVLKGFPCTAEDMAISVALWAGRIGCPWGSFLHLER